MTRISHDPISGRHHRVASHLIAVPREIIGEVQV